MIQIQTMNKAKMYALIENLPPENAKGTLDNCHFERSEKSMALIAKESSLCSE